MNVGWLGLGRLGLPCALALERYASCRVLGHDPSPAVARILADRAGLTYEAGLAELLAGTKMELAPHASEVVAFTDEVIFVAVQTPHDSQYSGETPAPAETADFDYEYLQKAIADLAAAAEHLEKRVTVVILSTTLPGTVDRELVPLAGEYVTLVYSPLFISLGSTVRDFVNPQLVVAGVRLPVHVLPLVELYSRMHTVTIQSYDFRTAELIKMARNTYQSMQVEFVNTIMRISHALGVDCDDVTEALDLAFYGGMPDGGPCRPRDLVAMRHLARHLDLDGEPFSQVTRSREAHARWIVAQVVKTWADHDDLPVVVLGRGYKPGSSLMVGSPALLLVSFLMDMGLDFYHYDPHTGPYTGHVPPRDRSAVFVIATAHPEFKDYDWWPPGSVIIDPHGYIPDREGVVVRRLGRRSEHGQ